MAIIDTAPPRAITFIHHANTLMRHVITATRQPLAFGLAVGEKLRPLFIFLCSNGRSGGRLSIL